MELSYNPSIELTSKSTEASDRVRACHSVYEQLPVNETRTRVLLLHSHSSSEALVPCSLEVITLDPEPSRAYAALSYVWGDASVTEDIAVNGILFAVTSNLATALQQIRKSYGEVLLWADAICVNQKDILERNQQVLLMKNIYTKAKRVIGWLGPDENGGGQGLKTLDALFRNAIQYPNNFEWARRMPELLTVNGTYTTDSGVDFESNDRLEKLQRLLRSPFWKRIWIVQELVLPLNLRLLCGEEFMDIPEPVSFYNTVIKLTKLNAGRPYSLSINVWMRLNECIALLRSLAALRFRHLHQEPQVYGFWKGISGFLRARVALEFHETSDPRDHVYGLSGLFELDIIPDYGETKSINDVYLEVAQHCLRTGEALDGLCLAGTRQCCNGLDCLAHRDSPSWVPDWRLSTPARLRLPRYPQSHAFPSNGGFQMQIVDHQWLRGSAVVWDTVSRIEHKTGWDLTEWDLAEDIDIENPGNQAYSSGISRFNAMVILWHGGYDGSKTSICDLQPDSELFRSYKVIFYAMIAKPWANKHGQREIPRLLRCMFGPNGLTIIPNAIPNGHRESYQARSRQLRYDMRCFHTERNYIGLGPLATEVGDIVCVLEGHKAPVLLRRRGSQYTFVGDCDVVGIMNGEVLEAVKRGEAEISEIEIR